MIVMPANSSGWFWHTLAYTTGRLGHLYSPGAERGPWPWFPFALDNKVYAYWDEKTNYFDEAKYEAEAMPQWIKLIKWAAPMGRAMWGIVRDVPGSGKLTMERYETYFRLLLDADIPPAIAVQNGMTPADVRNLTYVPKVICVGGTTEWKWSTVEMWAREFPWVHLLRCNSPHKLYYLESLGVKSCDGTGWSRGDRTQTTGLEKWAKSNPRPYSCDLAPFVCRGKKRKGDKAVQLDLFAQ